MEKGTLEKYQDYIEGLYSRKYLLRRDKFVNETSWKNFVPVIEGDAARFLQLMLQMKKPKNILEIGTCIGFSATSMALVAWCPQRNNGNRNAVPEQP